MKTIADYSPIAAVLKPLYFKQALIADHSDDLAKILSENPRLLVMGNHGSALGLTAATVGLLELLRRHGGAKRKPLVVTWRHYYKIPLIKYPISYLTQTDKALSAEQFVSTFIKGGFSDLLVYPEGENSMFGDGVTLQPFLSPGFIELALKIDVPILIVAHTGTRRFAREIPISRRGARLFRFLPKRSQEQLQRSGSVNIPRFFSGPAQKLTYSFALYKPSLTLDELAALDATHRKEALWRESDRVRDQLLEMMAAN